MLRMMVLGTLTVLALQTLFGAEVVTAGGGTTLAQGMAVAANDHLDSAYTLPEILITAPRIADENDYSGKRFQLSRTQLPAAVRRLIRIAGYSMIVIMSGAWIALTIARIPHIQRARRAKKHHLSYVYLARTNHDPVSSHRPKK